MEKQTFAARWIVPRLLLFKSEIAFVPVWKRIKVFEIRMTDGQTKKKKKFFLDFNQSKSAAQNLNSLLLPLYLKCDFVASIWLLPPHLSYFYFFFFLFIKSRSTWHFGLSRFDPFTTFQRHGYDFNRNIFPLWNLIKAEWAMN